MENTNILTWLPQELIIHHILSRLSMKTILQLRPVSNSCMSLISSPNFIETHLSKSNNGGFSFLPKIIIWNILLSLPINTLLLMKSVSKSWKSLISSHDFIETHLSKSTNDPQFTHHHIFVRYIAFDDNVYGFSNEFISLSLYSLLNEPSTKPVGYEGQAITIDSMNLVGHCKGLVCLEWHGDIFLWNPTTRKSRKLAKLEFIGTYGFCYDELNDDFKVVAIFFCGYHSKNHFSVYSSRTGFWRTTQDFPFEGCLLGNGMFSSGALYWNFRPSEPFNDQPIVIVSFDIKTETFREVLPPKFKGVCSWTLGTIGKSLSVCELHCAHANVWVMKKCGVEEVWTKLDTVLYMNGATWNMDSDGPTKFSYLKPISLCVNGDIVMMLNSRIQFYNSKDYTYKELFNRGEGYICNLQDTYVESLVSPYH